MLADMDSPLEHDSRDDTALVRRGRQRAGQFVNKVIIDAYNQKVSDIHIEPPGKAKTGICFRIDGTLQPYIEVPAQFRQAMVTRPGKSCATWIFLKAQAARRQDQV
jgi:type II secretory ATPase GspE/PulE/Tfp pilus assembly ATPase PilB-like protein